MNKKRNIDQIYDLAALHKVCTELTRLVVNLFSVEKKKFVYCSRSIQQVLGHRPEEVVGSGWSFWHSLIKTKERPVIKHKLSRVVYDDSPGLNSEIFALAYHVKNAEGDWIPVRHEINNRKLDGKLMSVSYISDLSERVLIDRYLGISIHCKPEGNFADTADEITEREKQVLKLIACGLSSKQIAQKLFISKHTAISHRKNLIGKFEVKNTAELITKASKVISL